MNRLIERANKNVDCWPISLLLLPPNFYCPPTKLRESNVFSPVCLSVWQQGGPHVTIIHDAISQLRVMFEPRPGPRLSPHREPDMSKLVHYVVRTISKWAVGIGLKCLLVVLNCVKDPKLMFLVWSASTLGILHLIVHAVPKDLGRVRGPRCYEIKVTELKIWNPLLSHISKNLYFEHNIDKIHANRWIKGVALGTSPPLGPSPFIFMHFSTKLIAFCLKLRGWCPPPTI